MNLRCCRCVLQTSREASSRDTQLLKGSAAEILVSDTTAQLQWSSCVHVMIDQGCFGSNGGPKQY